MDVPLPSTTRRELLRQLRLEFQLDWFGMHGVPHWGRVRLNGLLLARTTGARPEVVEYFSLLHDSQRRNDNLDPAHGARAAAFANRINVSLLQLDAEGLDMLTHACRHHSDGLTESNVTVQTCWDADRLDLGRVGYTPNPRKLCTSAGRDPSFIRVAYDRSLGIAASRRARLTPG